jgi:hypothetical protein
MQATIVFFGLASISANHRHRGPSLNVREIPEPLTSGLPPFTPAGRLPQFLG